VTEQQCRRKAVQSSQDVDALFLHPAVLQALEQKFKLSIDNKNNLNNNIHVVRRSLDARRNKLRADGRGKGPRFTYVVDLEIQKPLKGLRHVSGKMELLSETIVQKNTNSDNIETTESNDNQESLELVKKQQQQFTTIETSNGNLDASKKKKKRIIVVGAGPAGLFCALELAKQQENVEVILLERGRAVERRGKDIGALMHRNVLNPNSNFCFGEGGAGTWSDGKLTTRIGRNSQPVRQVLETLVKYGAPPVILVDGAPHLGTDNLVKLLRNMRLSLQQEFGAQIMFDTQMKRVLFDSTTHNNNTTTTAKRAIGVEYYITNEQNEEDNKKEIGTLYADAVVLATGHSARDVYQQLYFGDSTSDNQQQQPQVELKAKGFAVGFRIEHPQRSINQMQYGLEWGPFAQTGKTKTDQMNIEHFANLHQQQQQNQQPDDDDHSDSAPKKQQQQEEHEHLPIPSYRLATDKAYDGNQSRGVYSFCMVRQGQDLLVHFFHRTLVTLQCSFVRSLFLYCSSFPSFLLVSNIDWFSSFYSYLNLFCHEQKTVSRGGDKLFHLPQM
jgi:uncharacterized FAD-dependent dehydrogenase